MSTQMIDVRAYCSCGREFYSHLNYATALHDLGEWRRQHEHCSEPTRAPVAGDVAPQQASTIPPPAHWSGMTAADLAPRLDALERMMGARVQAEGRLEAETDMAMRRLDGMEKRLADVERHETNLRASQEAVVAELNKLEPRIARAEDAKVSLGVRELAAGVEALEEHVQETRARAAAAVTVDSVVQQLKARLDALESACPGLCHATWGEGHRCLAEMRLGGCPHGHKQPR